MRFEIAGLTPYQITVNGQRLEWIPLGYSPRLFEPFADTRGAETLFDPAGRALGVKIEQELAGFGFDEHAVVSDYDAAIVVNQFERGDRSAGIDQVDHAPKAALQWFEVPTLAQKIFCQPHDEQIVKRKTIVASW
jgi:hypothetical protein